MASNAASVAIPKALSECPREILLKTRLPRFIEELIQEGGGRRLRLVRREAPRDVLEERQLQFV